RLLASISSDSSRARMPLAAETVSASIETSRRLPCNRGTGIIGGVQVPGSIRYGIGRLSARRRQELVVRTPVARFWRPRAAWRVENRRLTNGRAAACKKAVAPGISLLQTAAPPETEAMRPATGMELSFRVLLDGCLTVEEQFAAGA